MDKNKLSSLFLGGGRSIYEKARQAVEHYDMGGAIENGVLVGFSGGADSVMLLCFLLEYRKRTTDFQILAVHINHGIRGDEADRDEAFSKRFCEELEIEFLSYKIDVPTFAHEAGIGIEEAARNARYSKFAEIISSRDDIATIAVAHNSDDNAETVLFNILRGSGTRGAAGIRPVRDNVVRPLIRVSKKEIVEALDNAAIPFVVDSTNLSVDYNRNYIRLEIMPRLARVSENPEKMLQRLSENLRCDDDYITGKAREFLNDRASVKNYELLKLHRAVFYRVLDLMNPGASSGISMRIAEDIRKLLIKDNFSYSLIGGSVFICERGDCRIAEADSSDPYNYLFKLNLGENSLTPYDADFILSTKKVEKTYLNVYKISIQASISSAIIIGSLYLRPKKDGDSVFYGGMTHKLKKLYNDRKIPLSKRKSIPILCDDKGVVWVPGFGVRDDGVPESERVNMYAALCIGKYTSEEVDGLHSGSEFLK